MYHKIRKEYDTNAWRGTLIYFSYSPELCGSAAPSLPAPPRTPFLWMKDSLKVSCRKPGIHKLAIHPPTMKPQSVHGIIQSHHVIWDMPIAALIDFPLRLRQLKLWTSNGRFLLKLKTMCLKLKPAGVWMEYPRRYIASH